MVGDLLTRLDQNILIVSGNPQEIEFKHCNSTCTLCKFRFPENTIQYNKMQYNTIQYNTIQYNTIQYNTIQYNTIQ